MEKNYKVINSYRKPFYLKNETWCPDKKIRLKMFVDEHFVERIIERFSPDERQSLMREIWRWIDENYCMLLFDAHVGETAVHYRIKLETATVAFVLYMNTLRIRTCFRGNEE